MPNDFIAVDTHEIDEIMKKIAKLADVENAGEAIEAVDEYLINQFQLYPSPKHITRKSAYGKTFFTDKQRRFFFAALADGRIDVPYNRTQTLRGGWKAIGQGYNQIVANETPYAYLVQQKSTMSRMMKKIGWTPIEDILIKRAARILEVFDGALKKTIHKLGLD